MQFLGVKETGYAGRHHDRAPGARATGRGRIWAWPSPGRRSNPSS